MAPQGQKRKRTPFQASGAPESTRRAPAKLFEDEQPRRTRKRNRDAPYSAERARPHKHAIHPIKSRIRDLERQLRKSEKLRADVRVAHERELAALRHEPAVALGAKTKREMVERYHMVRFYERQKAGRALKKAQKALDSFGKAATDDAELGDNEQKRKLERALHVAQVDLNYTQYSPLAWPYVSMWPRKHDDTEQDQQAEEEAGPKGDVEMWRRVEAATEDGARALDRLRNEIVADESTSQHDAQSHIVPAKSAAHEPAEDEPDEGSAGSDDDGGFFERA